MTPRQKKILYTFRKHGLNTDYIDRELHISFLETSYINHAGPSGKKWFIPARATVRILVTDDGKLYVYKSSSARLHEYKKIADVMLLLSEEFLN